MGLISQRSGTARQQKGMPLDPQQSLQGSLRRIPTFLVVLCGIQAAIILIICVIVTAHFFPARPTAAPPIMPGKAVPKPHSQNFHPALIEIGDYIVTVTFCPI